MAIKIEDNAGGTVGPVPTSGTRKPGNTTWWQGALIFVNVALGVGLLHLPFAVHESGGIAPALSALLVMALLEGINLQIMGYCADLIGKSTYSDVLGTICGPFWCWASSFCIASFTFGVCTVYLVSIGDQFDRLFQSMYGVDFCETFYLSREFTIIATSVCLILPMCFSKRIEILKYVGSIGAFVMIYPALLTALVYAGYGSEWIAKDIAPLHSAANVESVKRPETLLNEIITVSSIVPAICFSFQAHEVVVSVYVNFRRRTLGQLAAAVTLFIVLLGCLYSATAVVGYLTFGHNVRDNIMLNFDANSPAVLVGVFALLVKIIASYPLMLICGRESIEVLLGKLRSSPELPSVVVISATSQQQQPYNPPLKEKDVGRLLSARATRWTITLGWFFGSLVVALIVSDLKSAIELSGLLSFANTFIFPGMCLLFAALQSKRYRVKYAPLAALLGGSQIAVGVVCGGLYLFSKFVWNSGHGSGHGLDSHGLLCVRGTQHLLVESVAM